MGKITIKELAKRVNMPEDMVDRKLKGLGIKLDDGKVDESVVSKLQQNSAPHIIRRKVKVVTTDESGNKVERITTNAGGTIQKSVIRENNHTKPTYSKE